jgi:hypothetical protein
MLHEDSGPRMLPVMFCLRGGQLWFWVGFRFSRPFVRQVYCRLIAIIFIRPEKAEVKPHLDPIKPRGLGVEYGFHEGVVVDASRDETEEKEDLSVQGRDSEGLERMVFFFRCNGLPEVLRSGPDACALQSVYGDIAILFNELGELLEASLGSALGARRGETGSSAGRA